jgi:hypothetical protein
MEFRQSNPVIPAKQTAESTVIEIRTGQAPGRLARAEFSVRFRAAFIDPAFRGEDRSIERLEEIAWQAYTGGRKAPFTQKAGLATAIRTMTCQASGLPRNSVSTKRKSAGPSPRLPLVFC